MDSRPAPRGVADRGVSSLQFVLASGLALILFLVFANLVVVQYGKGALRSALEQGARAGAVGGVAACEGIARGVIDDLLGGRMSDTLVLSCSQDAAAVSATGSVTFESWTPLTPDFSFTLTSQAVTEP
ncbi:MAG TPA: hypothetical protein VMQ46_09660 [Acidimicrobiia bacterium]|nr:hypothetical protein [Acidimicrobiia bacterium]